MRFSSARCGPFKACVGLGKAASDKAESKTQVTAKAVY
jgi:hypothetical protein